ncbi:MULTISPECIES: hypothetical protein [Burkholderia cepacia complex]|uniref:Transposase n=1 Tax=Burkholderia ubonensis TaxID=101571 RepID=A0ABD6PUY4_9BURK|nr:MULTISPECIES: hypothetical protein [Burkholderia cepacia complex]KVQ76790.1 hypothetical protein WK05_05740 [Burkholderia ubonensis]KVZ09925.1 hypothetical protein WL11_06890 [Burkholderia ubonensis]KWA80909.1 hypothetical protein WL30_25140 [Burkholderia ubonensis]KWO56528.1 hypothetical protein WM28_02060 [Burkholderia ubonensis]OJA38541.1 hypothetical protein BGV66_30160 [Burkholderia ubonensis]
MGNFHLRSNLSALFERFHRKTTQVSRQVRPTMARACHTLAERAAGAWSTVRRETARMRRH